MESEKSIAVIGKNEALNILSSIKDRLPQKSYNIIIGSLVDRFINDENDWKAPCVTVNEKKYTLNLKSSVSTFETLELSTSTAAFIIAYSVVDFESSFAIGRKWIPAMKLYFPNIPIILLGYNNTENLPKITVDDKSKNTNSPFINQRNCAEVPKKADELKKSVTTKMGKQIAREIKATRYLQIPTSSGKESRIFEEAIRASLKNRKVLCCKIAVVGSPDSGKTEIIRRFVFGERLSVLDEYMNEQQYLYDADDSIFAACIEIHGEEFDLRIHDVAVEKVNKQWKLSKIKKVVPIMEKIKELTYDKENFLDRLSNALLSSWISATYPTVIAEQIFEEQTIRVTQEKLPPDYWLKDVDVVVFIFSVVQPESFYAITEELVSETFKHHESGIPSIILVRNQIDLRNDFETLNNLSKHEKQPITSEMGENLVRKINAVTYLECYCNERKNMETVFEEAVWSSLRKIEKEEQNQLKSIIETAKKKTRSVFEYIIKWFSSSFF